MRAPIVMANVNRTVASPWAFWPDQTDSLAQRDTGWIQYYVETAQEALDSVLHAFRVAEQVELPAMVNLDAFYVSHALEPVQVPSQELVDGYLPPYAPEHLSPEWALRLTGVLLGFVVVVYANTSAAVKARADWMGTSSIGLDIVAHLHAEGKKIMPCVSRFEGKTVHFEAYDMQWTLVDGGIRLRATTDDPDWYARQLAVTPLTFEVVGSPALVQATEDLAARLVKAAGAADDRRGRAQPPAQG